MANLTGKRALVTGGSRGIGAAIARKLAAEGARVALTYAQSPDAADAVVKSITDTGGEARAIYADNREDLSVTGAVERAAEEFGGLDILVCNAGVFEVGPLSELGLQGYDSTMSVNVRAVYVALLAADRLLAEGGRIVLIGSNLAKHVPGPGIGLYAMSKAALIGLAKGLSRDFGPRGITINVVHPGSTDTDMNPANGEYAEPQRSIMSIPRFNNPADVASLVAWLTGPDAGTVTGSEFTIDSGVNA
ncbi:SDR family NAD(P)-dependent oxidoreductase [Pacificispira sp.]|uniref:SDR family NAD(P)-dependent oxidoreductase n=1 Tax=Pacificispira sp. TaxID=2888761 RepID=UPI003BAD7696